MRETQAIIERVRRVATNLQQLDLSVDASVQLQPGQSVLACPLENEGWSPYLREQWIPVGGKAGRVVVEVPVERVYTPGRVVSLLSPVGRPIPLRSGATHVLMIVYDAVPTPLVLLASQCIADGAAVTLVLSGRALQYPLELLPPEVEILRGDTDWKWPDQVETLNWADQILALAPFYMQAEVYSGLFGTIQQIRQQAVPDQYVCGLFYPRLACGTGACQACQVPCRRGDKLACADGPAMDLKDLTWP